MPKNNDANQTPDKSFGRSRNPFTKGFLVFYCAATFSIFFYLGIRGVYSFGVDDSYIFYRYAENVSKGNGFVFNPGEPAGEGFTSWSWVMLLGISRYAGLDVVTVSKVLGILFHLVSAFMLGLIVVSVEGKRDISKAGAVALPFFLVFNYRLLAHSVSGMETSLYICALMALLYLAVRVFRVLSGVPAGEPISIAASSPAPGSASAVRSQIHWLWMGLGVFGMFLVRPEGVAAGGVVMAALLLYRRENLFNLRVWGYIFLGLVLPLALFIGFKMLIFGYPLPQSFYHKFITRSAEYGDSLRHMAAFLWNHIVWVMAASMSYLMVLFRKDRGKDSKYIYSVLFFFFLIMMSVYFFFYPAMNYLHRFYIPYFPVLLVLSVPLVCWVTEKVLAFPVRYLRPVLFILLAFLAFAAGDMGKAQAKRTVRQWSYMVNPHIFRASLGVKMGELPKGVVVANTEMGVIPYYSGLTCIDMAGLTDPYIAHHGLTMEYLVKRKVDVIIFNREVEKVSAKEWEEYTLGYKNVFLSYDFKNRFRLVGAFGAWPNRRDNYYLYADTTSGFYPAVEKWGKRYLLADSEGER